MSEHFVEHCSRCKAVVRQCRCPGPHTQRWVLCSRCLVCPTPDRDDAVEDIALTHASELFEAIKSGKAYSSVDVFRRAVQAGRELGQAEFNDLMDLKRRIADAKAEGARLEREANDKALADNVERVTALLRSGSGAGSEYFVAYRDGFVDARATLKDRARGDKENA